jgi:hypothetical protein
MIAPDVTDPGDWVRLGKDPHGGWSTFAADEDSPYYWSAEAIATARREARDAALKEALNQLLPLIPVGAEKDARRLISALISKPEGGA